MYDQSVTCLCSKMDNKTPQSIKLHTPQNLHTNKQAICTKSITRTMHKNNAMHVRMQHESFIAQITLQYT